MKKGQGAKPTPRPAAKPLQEVPSYESYHQVALLIMEGDVPEFEPGLLASALLLALERSSDTMEEATYAMLLRVAACLQKRVIDEHNSDMQARAIIKKAKAK